jgi:hypothetical protein
MRFTLKEFEEMYSGFKPQIQITPTDIAVMNGIKYSVKLIDNQIIELTEIGKVEKIEE